MNAVRASSREKPRKCRRFFCASAGALGLRPRPNMASPPLQPTANATSCVHSRYIRHSEDWWGMLSSRRRSCVESRTALASRLASALGRHTSRSRCTLGDGRHATQAARAMMSRTCSGSLLNVLLRASMFASRHCSSGSCVATPLYEAPRKRPQSGNADVKHVSKKWS
eukprot:3934405-Rhodomonas_salina.2